jgi:positive regulator of sigma E activity
MTKIYKDSRAIYACQLFGMAFGTIIMALFNHSVIGALQYFWGIVLGWLIGAGTYIVLLQIYPRENDCPRCSQEN